MVLYLTCRLNNDHNKPQKSPWKRCTWTCGQCHWQDCTLRGEIHELCQRYVMCACYVNELVTSLHGHVSYFSWETGRQVDSLLYLRNLRCWERQVFILTATELHCSLPWDSWQDTFPVCVYLLNTVEFIFWMVWIRRCGLDRYCLPKWHQLGYMDKCLNR